MDKIGRNNQNFIAAVANILSMSTAYVTMSTKEGTDASDFGRKSVPYDPIKAFHEEYHKSCASASDRAGKRIFEDAFNSLRDKVRLSGGKGASNTFDICNNTNDLLKSALLRTYLLI